MRSNRVTYVYCPVQRRVVERGFEHGANLDNGAPPLLDAPAVWGVMPETRHPIDWKVYDSRERYNAVTRRHNAIEIGRAEHRRLVERGNRPVQTGPTVAESIREALGKLGYL